MNKKIIITITILLILGGVALFIIFQTPEKKEMNNYQTLNLKEEAVLNLYQMANPSIYYSSIKDVYEKETFSNEYILGSAITLYLKDHPNTEAIKEEDIDLYINKIFGEVTYAHTSGYMINELLCTFSYDRANHTYTYQNNCEKNLTDYFVRKIISARKSETEYIMEDKMIFIKTEENTSTNEISLKIYNDVSLSNLLDTITYPKDSESPKISIEAYEEKASTYRYHFIFDGNSFVYKKLEKVN